MPFSTQFLTEAIVVNPQEIERYVARFARQTRPEIGQQWFQKKLRASLLNSPTLMQQVVATNSNYPDYANAAIQRGEPAYQFNPAARALQPMLATYEHLIDWFNAMHAVVERPATNAVEVEDRVVAQRELAKIMRYSPEQAIERAAQWYAKMGTRAMLSKKGVEVVLQWPNGFYAVRYTDKETMMTDGHDLQNCLRTGTYWESVENGSQKIFGIRRNNDEAIIGIRLTGKSNNVAEVKGKNNQPPIPAYVEYAVDLLNHLQAHGLPYDLQTVGVTYHKGKYGTFRETAETIYDQDGIKILYANNTYLALYGEHRMEVAQFHLPTLKLAIQTNDLPADILIKVLNIIELPPEDANDPQLSEHGILYNARSKTYGSVRDVGTKIGSYEDVEFYSVPPRFYAFQQGQTIARAVGQRHLTEVSAGPQLDKALTAAFLTAIKLPPTEALDEFLLRRGIVYADKSYLFDSTQIIGKLPQIAERYAIRSRDLSYAWLHPLFRQALHELASSSETLKPNMVGNVIAKTMLPKAVVSIHDQEIALLLKHPISMAEVAMPVAGIELMDALMGAERATAPLKRHLALGVKALLAYMKKHPFALIWLPPAVRQSLRSHHPELHDVLIAHQNQIRKYINGCLSDELSIQQRFAAHNILSMWGRFAGLYNPRSEDEAAPFSKKGSTE